MGLRVIQLVAENIKGLKAVDITPDQHFQIISGKNGQGKSSVLDSIWFALGGAEAAKIAAKPIRAGENTASVMLDLGDMIVTRKWKGDNTSLSVTTKDGAKYSSPQSMLDKLIGRLSFDPFAFAQLKDAEQRKTLMGLVKWEVDPDTLDSERKQLFDTRTGINRESKQRAAQLDAMEHPNEDIPQQEVSAAEVMKKITDANEVVRINNQKREELRNVGYEYQTKQNNVRTQTQIVDDLIKKLEDAKATLHAMIIDMERTRDRGRELKTEVELLKDPDLDALTEELNGLEQVNKAIRDAIRFKELQKNVNELEEKAREITQKMSDIDTTKQHMLSNAAFPIHGLGFDENGVTFQDIPFKQCSAAERLKVSMSIAMSLNPELRIIRILDGSLLDSENMKLIEDMAKERDYQVWIEVVNESGTVGLYIEDGEIKPRGAKAQ